MYVVVRVELSLVEPSALFSALDESLIFDEVSDRHQSLMRMNRHHCLSLKVKESKVTVSVEVCWINLV